MTKLHEKVAWAWLDRLLGKKVVEPSTPVNSDLSDAQKKAIIDDSYQRIKKDLLAALKNGHAEIFQQAERAGRRWGVQPLFLLYFLAEGKNWPSRLDATVKEKLRLLQALLLNFGVAEFYPNEMGEFPDWDRLTSAMMEMGTYGWGVVVWKIIVPSFNAAVSREAKRVLHIFKRPGGPKNPDAFWYLSKYFQKSWWHDNIPYKHIILMLTKELF